MLIAHYLELIGSAVVVRLESEIRQELVGWESAWNQADLDFEMSLRAVNHFQVQVDWASELNRQE